MLASRFGKSIQVFSREATKLLLATEINIPRAHFEFQLLAFVYKGFFKGPLDLQGSKQNMIVIKQLIKNDTHPIIRKHE